MALPSDPPTPEELALLRSVADNPADDTARLVYADWLDDQASRYTPCRTCSCYSSELFRSQCSVCGGTGRSDAIDHSRTDRARLIRLQCGLTGKRNTAAVKAVRAECEGLIFKNIDHWAYLPCTANTPNGLCLPGGYCYACNGEKDLGLWSGRPGQERRRIRWSRGFISDVACVEEELGSEAKNGQFIVASWAKAVLRVAPVERFTLHNSEPLLVVRNRRRLFAWLMNVERPNWVHTGPLYLTAEEVHSFIPPSVWNEMSTEDATVGEHQTIAFKGWTSERRARNERDAAFTRIVRKSLVT